MDQPPLDRAEQGVRRREAALDQPRCDGLGVGADQQHEIGAVAHLGQRRGHRAAVLHRAHIGEQAARAGMVDDAAGPLGQRQDLAHAGDIGAEPAEQRQRAGPQQPGSPGRRRLERRRLAIDRRPLPPSAARANPAAATGQSGPTRLSSAPAIAMREIVAAQGAERADHVVGHPRRLHAHATSPALSGVGP